MKPLAWLCKLPYAKHKWGVRRGKNIIPFSVCRRCGVIRQINQRKKVEA